MKSRRKGTAGAKSDVSNAKSREMEKFTVSDAGESLTTDLGVKISRNNESLKAGPRGPTLLEDFIFREKITHFDHERIPERVVHARGSGAYGYFEAYESMKEYTKASFLSEAGKRTPVFVRFSTVAGSRGSADTVRDVRGFATKFYTDEGNFDLVGNNMPVFFIQDAINFPDLIHAVKPEQDNEMPQAATAHDTFWDFVSSAPEIAHMTMWVMSDRAIPRKYSMMQGFGVNTFRFVNAKGKARFVKFHWKPALGVHSLTWDETQKLAGKDSDFNRRTLWEDIEAGNYPEYEFGVQMLDEKDEFAFDFDILDATKIWPEEQVPVKIIGKLVLNRNPDNFFAETEQVAFCPGNVVPGIDFSNDPLLQGRLFSYIDTQLIRLGGPNFHEIPINRPVVPIHSNQRDGHMRQMVNRGKVAYTPNGLAEGYPEEDPEHGFSSYQEKMDGRKIRERSDSFRDYFSQAQLFWNSMADFEKDHIVRAFRFELSKVNSMETRRKVVDMFARVDTELSRRIAEGIGVPASKVRPEKPRGIKKSPALSQANTNMDSIRSRKVAILACNGVNAIEISRMKDALESEKAMAEIVSTDLGTIKSSEGKSLDVDKNFLADSSIFYDAIFVPGGRPSVEKLMSNGDAVHFVSEAFKHCKPVAALGEGFELLGKARVADAIGMAGKAQKSGITSTKGVIMAQKASDLPALCDMFIDAMMKHRFWEREKTDMIPA
jgi:Catalase